MKRKRILIFTMLFVTLFTAVVYIRHMNFSRAAGEYHWKDSVTYIDENSNGAIDKGDTIRIKNADNTYEDFYVMLRDNVRDPNIDDIWLFAKGNLDVSDIENITQNTSLTGNINSSNTKKAFASNPGNFTAETTYVYTTANNLNIDDVLDNEPDQMSRYFEAYKMKLRESLKQSPADAIILSVAPPQKFHLTNYGCVIKGGCDGEEAPGWMRSTTYWTGDAAAGNGQIYAVIKNDNQNQFGTYAYNTNIGLRPLIIVETRDLMKEPIVVRFHNNNSAATSVEPANQNKWQGDLVTPVPDAVAPGYVFKGWHILPQADSPWDFPNSKLNSDLDLYAHWAKVVTLTADPQDCGTMESTVQTLEEGQTGQAFSAPVSSEKQFIGWYKDREGSDGKEFYFAEEPIMEDTTIYAKCTEITTIKWLMEYEMNGHGTQVPEEEVPDYGKATRPADPTDPDYVFAGWYKDNTFEVNFNFNTIFHENHKAYALWLPKVTLSFDNQGHGDPVDPQTGGVGFFPFNPDAPLNADVEFLFWSDKPNSCDIVDDYFDFSQPIVRDTIAYACWDETTPPAIKYTVDFVIHGHGTQPDRQIKNPGELATDPNMPNDGYWTFEGWYLTYNEDTGEYSNPYDFNTPVNSNIVLHAKWTPIKYTVDFVIHGHGAQPDQQIVDPEQKATDPNEQNDGNWTFEGWYLTYDENTGEYSNPYDFDTPVTSNIVLHAKWTPIVYIVDFVIHGHGAQPDEQEKAPGELAVDPDEQDDGNWKFLGWYLTYDPTTGEYSDPYDFNTPVNSNITLHAKWEEQTTPPQPNPHTVTYTVENEPTDEPEPDDETVEDGEKATNPNYPGNPHSCLVFDGWYTNPNYTGDKYDFNTPVTADVDLYGRWVTRKVTVTFDLQGHGGQNYSVEIDCGTNPTRPDPDPTDPDWEFIEWIVDPTDPTPYPFPDPIEEDVTIYAEWEPETPTPNPHVVTYTVKEPPYDETTPDDETVEDGEKATEPTYPAKEHSCLEFDGWYTTPDYTGTKYDFNTPVTADVHLYGRWVPTKVTLTFHMGGHGTQIDPITVTCGTVIPEPEEPTETGFKFVDWFIEPNSPTPYDFEEPLTEDKDVYGKWEKRTVTVKFENNDHGEKPEDEELEPDSVVPQPSIDDKEYVFEGWYLDPELTIPWDFDTPVDEDITLYAKWTRVESPQTFDSIILYVIVGIVSVVGLIGIIFIARKQNN